jgi:hypothetical protein
MKVFITECKIRDHFVGDTTIKRILNGELLPPKSLSLKDIHLVRCLTHISHRYFPPGRSLVLSSPATYRNVQQELIAEIDRTSVWLVVVTVDDNISFPDKTDIINRNGSYIILIPDGNLMSFDAEIIRLATEGKDIFTRFWNSEARYVVVGANKFTLFQQMGIFNYL